MAAARPRSPDGAASWEISPDVWRDPPLLRVSRVTENVPPRAPPALAEVLMVWISRSSTAVVVTCVCVCVCVSGGGVVVVVSEGGGYEGSQARETRAR